MQIQKARVVARKLDIPEALQETVSEGLAEHLPSETYNWAVVFLGVVTLLLALGAVLLPAFARPVADAL